MIKKLTILLLTPFLSSCLNCWSVKPDVIGEVSIQFNRCRMYCFDFYKLKAVSPEKCGLDWDQDAMNFPLEMCDGVVGPNIRALGEKILPSARKTRECYEDSCSR